MDFRVKELLKERGFLLTELAKNLGIEYPPFHKKINKPTLKTLEELEELTGIKAIEFIIPPAGFQHEYNDKGDWLGIYPTNGEKLPLYIKNELGEIIKIGEVDKENFKD